MAPTATTCLDVAIDHRIRRLFKPVRAPSYQESGTHTSIIEDRGRELRCPKSEINVTASFAGPATKGGIVVVLQQPREDHPFGKGVDAVIEDCETLFALWEMLRAASCDTLDIRTNVSVIDLLPYITESEPALVRDDVLRDSFQTATDFMAAKDPDVVLCAGKIWLPRAGKPDTRKGDAFKLESAGVGQTFGKYTTLRLRDGSRGWMTSQKVNGFHPSHAMNYLPHLSCLRQLLLLAAAETCGKYKKDWREEAWMIMLRAVCASMTKKPENATPVDGATATQAKTKYIPDYVRLYTDNLEIIHKTITSLAYTSAHEGSLYDELLRKRLTEACNDTSLILRQMARLERKGWAKKYDSWNQRELATAARKSLHFVLRKWELQGTLANRRFVAVVQKCTAELQQCVTSTNGQNGKEHTLGLDGACKAFLDLAVGLESLMGDLLDEDILRRTGVVVEDPLTGAMQKLAVSGW